MKILILGGYGVLGGRLAELLSDLAEVELLVAGRNLARATAFCKSCNGKAKVRPMQLDRRDIAEPLSNENPIWSSTHRVRFRNMPQQTVMMAIM